MTTITIEIPDQKAVEYKKILTSFVRYYQLSDLEQMKSDYSFSSKLYLDYANDIEWHIDSCSINTQWKNDNEVLIELNKNLWN